MFNGLKILLQQLPNLYKFVTKNVPFPLKVVVEGGVCVYFWSLALEPGGSDSVLIRCKYAYSKYHQKKITLNE